MLCGVQCGSIYAARLGLAGIRAPHPIRMARPMALADE
jgi:hypothetical protein